MTTQPKSVHFGAGNVGRGFIGALLADSGYHVIFADVDRNIVDELNRRGSYRVHILNGQEDLQRVSSVSGIFKTDDIVHELADSRVRLVTTAVGPNVLQKIAPTIAPAPVA